MTHIMIDLETWGKRPGCDIRSIGATVFDPMTGHVAQRGTPGTFYIATMNPIVDPHDRFYGQPDAFYSPCKIGTGLCHRYGLTRDPETVEWWINQSPEARGAFVEPVDLREALQTFGLWLANFSQDGVIDQDRDTHVRIWAHGPTFDVSILSAAYEAVGLPIPWHYRAPRDTRTIMEAAGMDPHKGLEQFATGTYHHALDDAITQAKAVCAAYTTIKGWQDVPAPRPDPIIDKMLEQGRITCRCGSQRHLPEDCPWSPK